MNTPLRAVVWAAVSTRPQAQEEKDSLPDQVRQGETLARREGWRLLATLQVPGHSRRYLDFHELARDARAQGIDAFDDLLRLINAQAFDVLIVRDGDRFARTQALHAFITESVIDSGARIYSLADGWIDQHNYRMWIAMSGYKAAGEIDSLKKRRDVGMRKRVANGLHANTPPYSHSLIRDPRTGRPERLVVDESKRRFFDDLYTLMLEGVAYNNLETELYKRFGHIDTRTGQPFTAGFCWSLLNNPQFWGHGAYNYWRHHSRQWVYDDSVQVPGDVIFYRDQHEAVYQGLQAEAVKAELLRRSGIRGNAKPGKSYMFSGLLVCAECGCSLVVWARERWIYYRCMSHLRHRICTQRKRVSQQTVQRYVHALLAARLAGETLTAGTLPPPNLIAQLQAEITALEHQIRAMIIAQTTSPAAQAIYAELINESGQRLETLKTALNRAEITRRDLDTTRHMQEAAIIEIGPFLDDFWQRPAFEIHRLLHQVFGKTRLVVKNGIIIGLV